MKQCDHNHSNETPTNCIGYWHGDCSGMTYHILCDDCFFYDEKENK